LAGWHATRVARAICLGTEQKFSAKRLEDQCRTPAAATEKHSAMDLADKDEICYYVAHSLDDGNVPPYENINRVIDLFGLFVPLYAAAEADGRIFACDHDANMRWVVASERR
jgi:hypothetical protein